MASNTPGANHNVALANLYFDLDSKNAEGKVKCRKCEVLCKDNNFVRLNKMKHILTKNCDWFFLLNIISQHNLAKNKYGRKISATLKFWYTTCRPYLFLAKLCWENIFSRKFQSQFSSIYFPFCYHNQSQNGIYFFCSWDHKFLFLFIRDFLVVSINGHKICREFFLME